MRVVVWVKGRVILEMVAAVFFAPSKKRIND